MIQYWSQAIWLKPISIISLWRKNGWEKKEVTIEKFFVVRI